MDVFEKVAADAHSVAADLHNTEVTHPLTGERSPLAWATEPEPIFQGLLKEQELPWFAPGARFPSKIIPGQVVAVLDVRTKDLCRRGAA